MGQYWNKDTQLDVVGLRDDGWTDLGECKWGRVRSVSKLAAELEGKVGLYPNPRNATIGRWFFLRDIPKVRGELPPGQWIDLPALYGER